MFIPPIYKNHRCCKPPPHLGNLALQAITLLLAIFILLFANAIQAETIQFRAEKVSSTAAKGRERTQLEGSVFVDVNNSSIETDRLDIYGEDRDILVAQGGAGGHVRIDNREQELSVMGRQLFFNRKTELLRMRSGIELEDRKNEVIVYCDFMEYDEKNDVAKLQILVRIFSEDITARSEYALYNRKTQIVELSGAPIVYKGEDRYQAARIFVNLETKDVTLDNGVEGEIIAQDEEPSDEQNDEPNGPN